MAKKKLTFRFNFGLQKGSDGLDGLDGADGADGRDGVNGKNGDRAEMRFTKTSGKNDIPSFQPNAINPGDQWSIYTP